MAASQSGCRHSRIVARGNMADINVFYWGVAILFFIVALAYSSVGLAGGSSYTAIMVLLGFGAATIPLLSLLFNLLVSSLASYHFIKQKHLRLKLILPFLLSSMPMAWFGGTLHISPLVFQWLLFFSLFAVILRIYFWKNTAFQLSLNPWQQGWLSLLTGAVLGLLAGIVGIGGGIFLVPVILVFGLGSIKEAAACGAVFICLNSLAGIASRLQYHDVELYRYLPMLLAVIVGGILGSRMGAAKLSPQKMEKILGSIVIVALLFLSRKLIFT